MKLNVISLAILISACSPSINKRLTTGANPGGAALGDTINVLSYNIHHCNPPGTGTLINLDTIAGVIRKLNPDVVALQEVDVNTRRSGNINQAVLLGEKTAMQAYFFKAIDHDGGEYGIAILSKLEVSSFKQYPLPTIAETKGEPRILGTVTLKSKDGKELLFACTHLDAQSNSQNRLLQIREINSILKKNPFPVIIAGDLNASTGSEVINIFDEQFTRTCTTCAFTIPVKNPNKTIDFIGFAPSSKFKVEKHQVINETYASDHLPVNAKLILR